MECCGAACLHSFIPECMWLPRGEALPVGIFAHCTTCKVSESVPSWINQSLIWRALVSLSKLSLWFAFKLFTKWTVDWLTSLQVVQARPGWARFIHLPYLHTLVTLL